MREADLSPSKPESHPEDGRPWWRYPVVWMVVAGPLSVVFACIVTWIFIMRAPEQILTQTDSNENPKLEQKGKQYVPAQKGRDQAATNAFRPADN